MGCTRSTARFTPRAGRRRRGRAKGVKANARGVNFNKHVTGDNLFMMLP
jgi:hypothetical protein